MKVVQLFWEPRRSGITGHVLGLARSLPPEVERVFFAPAHLDASRRELEAVGARVEAVDIGNKVLPRAALRRLPALLSRERPDVLHVHALEAGLWGHLAARLARVPALVFTPHTDTIGKKALFPLYAAVWRAYGRATDVLLASTEAQRARLVALRVAPEERVLLGPGGVLAPAAATSRDPAARRAARAALGWPQDGALVGQVGRLVPQKDPLALVRLAADLERAGETATVVLVGDGPLEQEGRALAASLGVERRVLFAGFVGDLERVYAALDVLVLASRWEGLSVVLLEALARGLAVAATANEGNAAVVRDRETGRAAAPADAQGLCRAVVDLLRDPVEAARLGDGARALVLAEYDERVCAARVARAYEVALGGSRSRNTFSARPKR